MRGGPGPGVEVDHYARLGLARDATAREVAAAFRRQARLHHPDVGGSAADFAAIEEAYRVLRDPASRAAYDADLAAAEPGDDWADVGWGVPAEEPAPAPTASAGPDAPEVLTPFAPGATALPEVDPGPLVAPTTVPGWVGGAAAAGAAAAGLVLLVAGLEARIGLGWLVLTGMALPYGVAAYVLARPAPGNARVAAVVFCFSLLPLVASWTDVAVVPAPLVPFCLVLMLASVLGGLSVRLRRARRLGESRAQRDLDVRRAELITRWSLAVEWNRARDALLDPTARAVSVGPVAAGPYDVTGEVDRCLWDPVLAVSTVRRVPPWLAEGQWAVLDGTGEVVAVASHGAPEAWADVMAGAPLPPAARR